jgi:hypothetical protein
MRAPRTAAVAALALFLGGTGCAPAASGGATPADGLYPEGVPAPTVRVTNNHWSTMNVFAMRGSSRFRLGMVTSMSSRVFRIPTSVMGGEGRVQLMADPIGSTVTFTAPAVYVHAGDQVRFDIQNHLPISHVSVFRTH